MADFILACGTVCQIDEADRALLSPHTWRVDRDGYAYRKTTVNGKDGSMVFMHRVVFKALEGMIIDHIDGNGLNNQKSNLRVATVSQNSANCMKRKGLTSKHKGVCLNPNGKNWRAAISVNKKTIYLGTFDNEDEAGHAYNKAAIAAFGEFARLNPIGEDYDR